MTPTTRAAIRPTMPEATRGFGSLAQTQPRPGLGEGLQDNTRKEKAMTQYERLAKLLTRKRGATSLEIIQAAGTVSPHSRLSEMKAKGWTIWRKEMDGKTYGRYFGMAPKKEPA